MGHRGRDNVVAGAQPQLTEVVAHRVAGQAAVGSGSRWLRVSLRSQARQRTLCHRFQHTLSCGWPERALEARWASQRRRRRRRRSRRRPRSSVGYGFPIQHRYPHCAAAPAKSIAPPSHHRHAHTPPPRDRTHHQVEDITEEELEEWKRLMTAEQKTVGCRCRYRCRDHHHHHYHHPLLLTNTTTATTTPSSPPPHHHHHRLSPSVSAHVPHAVAQQDVRQGQGAVPRRVGGLDRVRQERAARRGAPEEREPQAGRPHRPHQRPRVPELPRRRDRRGVDQAGGRGIT